PGMVFPLIGFWGLKEILTGKVAPEVLRKGFITALAVCGGLCLIVWLLPNAFLSFQSAYDARFSDQFYYDALLSDRASLASADAFRSLMFVLLTAGLVFLYLRAKDKQKVSAIVCVGITVLTVADLWSVDKRYLNDSNYKEASATATYEASAADREILKDNDLSYRVINLNNPFQETNTSYFHHSIGGYHAAKLRRYNELIQYRLQPELNTIMQAFGKEQATAQSIREVFPHTPSLNMLNMRYVIYNPAAPPVHNPFAFGNAWFVSEVQLVENADAEIEALNTVNPLKTAIVDRRFAGELEAFTAQHDSLAQIELTEYRPNRLTYQSNASSEQLAVFSEIYYQPGWEATIDGKPTTHFRADWTLRAMRIPAGEHRIVFDFRPEGYVVAANMAAYGSFLILLLVIGAIGHSLWRGWRKKGVE
ncbi:MAG: YfhO family protein, partial [Tannerellaceae bacterium]|nr:YfhO family protein [Tannerellaceae bacterium]